MAAKVKPGKRDHSRLLIVEGASDRHSITSLIEHFVDWPKQAPWPVWVEIGDSETAGDTGILERGFLPNEFKAAHVASLGVVLDADDHAAGRYQRVRQLMGDFDFIPGLPSDLPSGGLVTQAEGKRFGLWVMPDNSSGGKIEDFLRLLVPEQQQGLWRFAEQSVSGAKEHGAEFRAGDVPKANLYTWLAWQDRPGQQPGVALSQRVLDPHGEHAQPFVNWFRKLFEL